MAGSVRHPFSVTEARDGGKSALTRNGRPGPAGSHPLRSAVAAGFRRRAGDARRGDGNRGRAGHGHCGGYAGAEFHPGYRRQAEDLTMETALSVIGLLACILVFGRLRRRTRLNELMLACALAVLALSNLFL